MRTENGAGSKGRRQRARRQGPVVGETVQPWLVAAHGSLVDVVVSGDASVCCRAVAGKGLWSINMSDRSDDDINALVTPSRR